MNSRSGIKERGGQVNSQPSPKKENGFGNEFGLEDSKVSHRLVLDLSMSLVVLSGVPCD